MLFDPFNRRLNYLRISLTDRCNLRCLYCMPEEGVSKLAHEDILSYEELLRLARLTVALGIEKIRLTGGEPLTRKGAVPFMAELARIRGVQDISLTTNGILLVEQAKAIWEAGIRRINVSLDSLNPERYARITRSDSFHRVWEGIQTAEAIGFDPIKINVVALKGINEEEIAAFGRLSLAKPYQIRFIEFMPVGPSVAYPADRFLPAERILERLQSLGPLQPINGDHLDGPARRWAYTGARGEVGLISPVSQHFCPTCNRLRLTSDGKLRTCIFSDRETDLRGALRNGASDDDLEMIIRAAIASKPREHHLNASSVPQRCQRQMSKIGG